MLQSSLFNWCSLQGTKLLLLLLWHKMGKSETLALRAQGSSHGCYGDFWKTAGAAFALKAQL